jgi:hypothetical protein
LVVSIAFAQRYETNVSPPSWTSLSTSSSEGDGDGGIAPGIFVVSGAEGFD